MSNDRDSRLCPYCATPCISARQLQLHIDMRHREAPRAPEEISCSAVKYPWGEVVSGFRHSDVMNFMAGMKRIITKVEYPQGFITNRGRFVGRHEAAEIARRSGQVPPDFSGELYSEDVWPDSPLKYKSLGGKLDEVS